MNQFQGYEPRSAEVIRQPDCPKCGTKMWLAQIEPDKPNHDKRTFVCSACDAELAKIVRYRSDDTDAVA